jgi:aspartate racemase
VTKIIGILGGMGPQATIDLYQKILNLTQARTDQEHLRVLIWSDPTIPDRTAAILGSGVDPTPQLVHGARILVGGGADCIVIPCNTAHYFAKAIQEAVDIPVLNMIKATAEVVASGMPAGAPVGILASTGTLKSNLYQRALSEKGIEYVIPDELQQVELMNAIFDARGIKAGFVDEHNRERVLGVLSHLRSRGAQGFIAGCTELPLVLSVSDVPDLFDPTEIMARAAISFARATV